MYVCITRLCFTSTQQSRKIRRSRFRVSLPKTRPRRGGIFTLAATTEERLRKSIHRRITARTRCVVLLTDAGKDRFVSRQSLRKIAGIVFLPAICSSPYLAVVVVIVVIVVVVVVVFFGVGAFVADVEFVELPHATFQFIDGIRTVGIVFVVVEVVVAGIGFGFGRTFINDNFFACDVETFTGLGTTTDGALTAVIGLGIG